LLFWRTMSKVKPSPFPKTGNTIFSILTLLKKGSIKECSTDIQFSNIRLQILDYFQSKCISELTGLMRNIESGTSKVQQVFAKNTLSLFSRMEKGFIWWWIALSKPSNLFLDITRQSHPSEIMFKSYLFSPLTRNIDRPSTWLEESMSTNFYLSRSSTTIRIFTRS